MEEMRKRLVDAIKGCCGRLRLGILRDLFAF